MWVMINATYTTYIVQHSLVVCTVYLILLPDTDGLHPAVPATTHHVASILKLLNLVTGQSDLSSSRDSLACLLTLYTPT